MNTPMLVQVSGATFRQLDHWSRKGLLRPVGGEGTGHVRDFPAEEVQVAKVMARLVGAGISPEAAARAARSGGELAPGVRVDVDLAVTV
jgi:DNA-binding transcriptional MerR regulator